MIKVVKFQEGQRNYMFPNGALATPEVIKANFPSVQHFTHYMEINGDVCGAVMNLGAMRGTYNIDENLTEEEALAAIEVIINTPQPEPEPSAEERIAAAMEFQNIMSL